ncbi:MAG: peptide chain release factor N(5)-glutamine methyltransferase [Betaproteobacteria bacterium]|nr:peptide chain release factor N(5)-glutamine methyltransferase [Betaproteobacteria bacterium]MCC6247144.1 peptide chain release factor N(5)-glutamine methyltransferase [Rubrivivax sp.]MCL4699690.1 peptide chain release factor N(5)-glutamine methyltransferase [Burkholderiaceae bacterium]
MRIGEWLQRARAAGVARLDAQQLLAHHLGRPRTWVLAHDDEALAPEVAARFDADVARRADGVPLAYLVGEREFHGLALQVNADVLVPRPETEGLVDWALELAPEAPIQSLADLGTGSGAIALAFKARAAHFDVWASDRSAAALAVAQANAARLGLHVGWLDGDWWAPFAGRRFGLVVSNPPYVAEGDAHLRALRHEPVGALVAGPDGLHALTAIVAGTPEHLAAGGWLLLEHGFDQAGTVAALLRARGFEAITTRRDLAGQPRLTGARWSR